MLGLLLRTLACFLVGYGTYMCARMAMARLQLIGYAKPTVQLDDILRDRSLSFLVFGTAAIIVSYAISLWFLPLGLLAAYVLSKRAPAMLDAKAARELRSACDEQADVMADIIAMGVDSGLSFDAAVDLYCGKFDNELACNMRRAHSQWTSGLASRQQALTDLSDRIGSKAIRRFSETSLQAIHHGSPLADMLSRFSGDIRRARKNAIERQIEKAPIKMLVPTGTCILPAMLILVMGPVLLQFMSSGY